jgi:hypothetical protein
MPEVASKSVRHVGKEVHVEVTLSDGRTAYDVDGNNWALYGQGSEHDATTRAIQKANEKELLTSRK